MLPTNRVDLQLRQLPENIQEFVERHESRIDRSQLRLVLDEKVRAASAFDYLSYCGEEDLLGHYLLNYKESDKRHVIGPKNEAVKASWSGS